MIGVNQSENGHAFLASSGNHSGLSQHTGPVNGGCLLCVSFILRVGCADLKIIGWGMHEIFHRNTAIGSRYHSADRHRHINAGIAGHSADRVRSWMLDIGAVVDCERIMLNRICDYALIIIFGSIAIGCFVFRKLFYK